MRNVAFRGPVLGQTVGGRVVVEVASMGSVLAAVGRSAVAVQDVAQEVAGRGVVRNVLTMAAQQPSSFQSHCSPRSREEIEVTVTVSNETRNSSQGSWSG